MFDAFNISSSGMTAQRLRMDIIADNIANADTTRTSDGSTYRRKIPIFQAKEELSFKKRLKATLGESAGGQGVKVINISEDQSPFKLIFNPGHPDANEDGYVTMPNVNIVTEMVDMIDAARAFEANITALNTYKSMAMKAIEIGRG
ncbi:MAG: flagellar basal body rod protein FlgC [Halanaerobiales bacterium]|nr:flagellar basal body rod protein FlgC [Halanaerobiales bacterium]